MIRMIGRRLIWSIPTFFGVSLIIFILFYFVGGDPAALIAGKYAGESEINRIREELGLNLPIWQQYLFFLKQIFTFDFGRSWQTQELVSNILLNSIIPSLSITIPSFILILLITLPLSLFLVSKKNSWVDQSVLGLCLALMSISSLVYILAGQYFLAYKLALFPISGWSDDFAQRMHQASLPILVTVTISVASFILYFRTLFSEEYTQDYVRTAKSKGLSLRQILAKHVFFGGLSSAITLIVMQIPFLMIGSILVESFFSIPGLGGVLNQAIQNSDRPVIQAMSIMGAIVYMVFYLLTDLLVAFFDPRVNLE